MPSRPVGQVFMGRWRFGVLFVFSESLEQVGPSVLLDQFQREVLCWSPGTHPLTHAHSSGVPSTGIPSVGSPDLITGSREALTAAQL